MSFTTDKWITTTLFIEPAKRPFLFITRPDVTGEWPYLCHLQGHKIGSWSAEWLACSQEEFHWLLGAPSERTEARLVEVWNRLFEMHKLPTTLATEKH
jgi:hypothetical protein